MQMFQLHQFKQNARQMGLKPKYLGFLAWIIGKRLKLFPPNKKHKTWELNATMEKQCHFYWRTLWYERVSHKTLLTLLETLPIWKGGKQWEYSKGTQKETSHGISAGRKIIADQFVFPKNQSTQMTTFGNLNCYPLASKLPPQKEVEVKGLTHLRIPWPFAGAATHDNFTVKLQLT